MNAAPPRTQADARAQALRELGVVLGASDAIERVGFEVYNRIRPIQGSCLRSATRLVSFAGQSGAIRLDDAQRKRAVACLKAAGFAALSDADLDRCLLMTPVREIVRGKSRTKGAAA